MKKIVVKMLLNLKFLDYITKLLSYYDIMTYNYLVDYDMEEQKNILKMNVKLKIKI